MFKLITAVSSALLVLSGCDAMMPTRSSSSGWGDETRAGVEAALQEATKMPAAPAVAQPPYCRSSVRKSGRASSPVQSEQ